MYIFHIEFTKFTVFSVHVLQNLTRRGVSELRGPMCIPSTNIAGAGQH